MKNNQTDHQPDNVNSLTSSRQSIRLYGRQQSRPLKTTQQKLFNERMTSLTVQSSEIESADQAILEVGFGSGEHIAHKAKLYPNALFIGCEPFINGVGALLMAIDEQNIQNIRIFNADVRRLYPILKDNSFDSIYLLYPDPWPKKRHWKRRFVQKDTFLKISNLLKPNGTWYIATDHPLYQEWVENLLKDKDVQKLFKNTHPTPCTVAWPDFIETRYQSKALREGRIPQYYTLTSMKMTSPIKTISN